MERIVLASRSPRRRELLALAGIDCIVDPSDIEEVIDFSLPIEARMRKLAYEKTLPTFKKHPHDIVVGADTIVYLEGETIGKAHSYEEAFQIIKKLQGKTHHVYIGVCVMHDDIIHTFCDHSEVTFVSLSDEEIKAYLDLNQWQGKAGAYGIQDVAVRYVSSISGNQANIVGLPIAQLYQYLTHIQRK